MKFKSKKNLIINISLLVVVVLLIVIITISSLVATPSVISGSSMQNTLMDGQFVFIHKVFDSWKTGDIIVYKNPEGKRVVKRLLANQGDRVEFYKGQLIINNRYINEPYVIPTKFPDTERNNGYPPNTLNGIIPDGMFFALGDNRDASKDGRDYGPIPWKNVIGKIIVK